MNAESDKVMAEHDGYRRLAQPVTHRREVQLDKRKRFWIVEDTLSGAGEHLFCFRFHFADGLETNVRPDGAVLAYDKLTGARLFVWALDAEDAPELEPRFVSRDYGAKSASLSACWKIRAGVPLRRRWAIVPVCLSDNEEKRLGLTAHLRS